MITKNDCRKIADYVFTYSDISSGKYKCRIDGKISNETGVDYGDVDSFINRVYKMIDEMPDDLKPCPFCGSEDVSVDTMLTTGYVRCKTCQAFGPTVCSETNEEAVEEAIKLWNKRTDDNE